MEVRPFDETDWMAFAGAERGPLGQTPAIAFGSGATVVVDRDGVQIFISDTDDAFVLSCTFAAGLAIVKALVDPLMDEQLEALGFTRAY